MQLHSSFDQHPPSRCIESLKTVQLLDCNSWLKLQYRCWCCNSSSSSSTAREVCTHMVAMPLRHALDSIHKLPAQLPACPKLRVQAVPGPSLGSSH
jgi:hypothetical protein